MFVSKYYDHPLNTKLRNLIYRLGYDDQRAADILGRPVKSIYHWLGGGSKPSPEAIKFLELLFKFPELREHLETQHPAVPRRPRGRPPYKVTKGNSNACHQTS